MKQAITAIIILAIIAITFFIGKDYGSKGEKVECQSEKIQVNNTVNETVKKAIKRRRVNATVPISDVWDRLFKKYCSDCTESDNLSGDLRNSKPAKKGS